MGAIIATEWLIINPLNEGSAFVFPSQNLTFEKTSSMESMVIKIVKCVLSDQRNYAFIKISAQIIANKII